MPLFQEFLKDRQIEAIAKHYGCTSKLIDFTTSLPIAAFFALGGQEFYKLPKQLTEKGKIFKIVVSAPPLDFPVKLITVPSVFSRPNHQYGVFIEGENLEKYVYEYEFYHFTEFRSLEDEFLDFLPDVGPLMHTSLASYLMPESDIWDRILEALENNPDVSIIDISKLFSEIHSYKQFIEGLVHYDNWISELCIFDLEGEVPIIDIELLGYILKENPYFAQHLIKFLVIKCAENPPIDFRITAYFLGYAFGMYLSEKKFEFIITLCCMYERAFKLWQQAIGYVDSIIPLIKEEVKKDTYKNWLKAMKETIKEIDRIKRVKNFENRIKVLSSFLEKLEWEGLTSEELSQYKKLFQEIGLLSMSEPPN